MARRKKTMTFDDLRTIDDAGVPEALELCRTNVDKLTADVAKYEAELARARQELKEYEDTMRLLLKLEKLSSLTEDMADKGAKDGKATLSSKKQP